MARLNVRLRTALFSALMDQELAYFNATKTGACSILKVHDVPEKLRSIS